MKEIIGNSSIGDLEKRRLYKEMLRIRIVEEELMRYYAEQEMRCPVHFCVGQEAVSVGVCQSLVHDDSVMSSHRCHGHYLAKGGSLKGMVAELYGKSSGCASGKGGSMHLIDLSVNFLGATSIVAGTIPVAVGVGFSNKLRDERSVSVVFFGDGATEEGLFYESLNFAELHNLPVLFVCEHNLFSVYSPISVRQPSSRDIYQVAASMGLDSIRIDGNDVETVYSTTQSALDSVRSGNGPYLIEAMTYRWVEHCGPNYDNHIGYRTEEEYLSWREKDPVATFEDKLLNESTASKEFIETTKQQIFEEIREVVDYAKELPFPDSSELTKGVYAS